LPQPPKTSGDWQSSGRRAAWPRQQPGEARVERPRTVSGDRKFGKILGRLGGLSAVNDLTVEFFNEIGGLQTFACAHALVRIVPKSARRWRKSSQMV
jgi:hypothetical protein